MWIFAQNQGHKQSADDEKIISVDLRSLRPFREEGRSFETFVGISHDPTHSLDKVKFEEWIDRHKKNIVLHYPATQEAERSSEDSEWTTYNRIVLKWLKSTFIIVHTITNLINPLTGEMH
jgi:hypothetical protein